MKIGFLAHNLGHDNGAGVFANRIVEGVKKAGFEVVVLTSIASGKTYEKALISPNRFQLLRNFLKIRCELEDCDLIHALDLFPYGFVAFFCSLGLHKKMVLTLVGSGSIIPLYNFWQKWPAQLVIKKARHLTAISSFVAKEVLKKLPAKLDVSVITPGIDFAKFQNPKPELVAKFSGLYSPYLIGVGSLRWRKGYKYTISGFAKLAKQLPTLKYVIVGKKYSDKQYNKIVDLIRELNLENRVVLLTDVDDLEVLKALYAGAEVFGLLSQNIGHDVEGFGMVFLEAAALGLPIVGSKDCGVEEASLSGQNGYLVDSTDVDGFVFAVGKIIASPNLRRAMSEKSVEFAKSQGWDDKIKAYLKIYESII
ncbi:MAG: glycosyltransferase family 4 protein [Candidatus Paceibacterota bacterium]|jgi:phosphatidylinositol alpha-1,6-mannosyltransferase